MLAYIASAVVDMIGWGCFTAGIDPLLEFDITWCWFLEMARTEMHAGRAGFLRKLQPVQQAAYNPEANWSGLVCLSSQCRIIPLCNSVTWAHKCLPGCNALSFPHCSHTLCGWCINLLIFKDRCSIFFGVTLASSIMLITWLYFIAKGQGSGLSEVPHGSEEPDPALRLAMALLMCSPKSHTLIRSCILSLQPSHIWLTSRVVTQLVYYCVLLQFTGKEGAVLPQYEAIKQHQLPQLQT